MPEANAMAQANVSEQKRGFLLCCFVLIFEESRASRRTDEAS